MNISIYKDIIVNPYQFTQIENLKICKKPNEHTTLVLTGVLTEELKDSYVQEPLLKRKIEVLIKDGENPKKIFSGMIQTMEVSVKANEYYLTIEAVSHSKAIDVELVRRSYQKLSMPYKTLMETAVEKYGASLMDKATNGKTIDNFILQYDETAWDFVKRMASRFNTPLIVEDTLDTPQIYIGLPNKDNIGNLEDFVYNIKKETNRYRDTTENYKESAMEIDYVHYQIFSEGIFEIANEVTFKGRTFYINEVLIEMKEGAFSNVYKLTDKKGFHINRIKNDKIIGLSLEGYVQDVARDDVKILLDIDKPYPSEELCWFKYSTPYTANNGGGFYCMPEIGEKVSLYMPDKDDDHAYSTGSVREPFTVGNNPDIKYWRTYAGKEIVFTPGGIRISCLDGEMFIDLAVEDGIVIQSNKPINIIANEGAGVGVYAEGKIVLAAGEEFDAYCNGSRINMKNGETQIRGINIRNN